MRFLLDTNIVSELRKASADAGVASWASRQSTSDLAISVVTVVEIEIGILRRARTDPLQAERLRTWLDSSLLTGFAGRILPIDLATARLVAPLHVPDTAPAHDALIAATALARGLTVVTRNVRDFERTGVELVNPWSAA
ncbi:MAG: type II toxin-antitoxin system VapC family toxin [Nocardioides sp.]